MSKGSRPRPFSVSQEELGNKFDSIFGEKPKKPQYVPPPLPEIEKTESKISWVTPTNDSNKE